MTQYQVGDKIHIEFTVDNIDNSGIISARRHVADFDGSPTVHSVWEYINSRNPAIVKVIPKPWEPKVGDTVEYKREAWSWAANASGTGTVLCVHGQLAWVDFEKLDAPTSVLLQAIQSSS